MKVKSETSGKGATVDAHNETTDKANPAKITAELPSTSDDAVEQPIVVLITKLIESTLCASAASREDMRLPSRIAVKLDNIGSVELDFLNLAISREVTWDLVIGARPQSDRISEAKRLLSEGRFIQKVVANSFVQSWEFHMKSRTT